MTQATPRTLSERLSEGKLPVGEALHLAMTLADALRKMHDSGRVYGALTPSSIRPTGTGVDLAAAPEPGGSVTPYTAPEVLHGKSPDTRADIFAFGAILFEMLTGRRAFDGDNEASLTAALTGSAPPSSGSPLVDRLVASCVAKDPAVRCQRMQKIIMELKLLSVAARRAETPAPQRGQAEAQLRVEIQQLEARAAARMASHERATAQMQEAHEKALALLREEHQTALTQIQEAASDVNTLRGQLADANARIVETKGSIGQSIAEVRAMVEQIVARVEHTVEPLGRRVADVEKALQDLSNRSAALHENLASDLTGIEHSLAQHAASIDSARTAMAQTDDLVERVVEALELLQSSVLDQHESRSALID